MTAKIQAYAARVKEMSPSRIASNLKSHEALLNSDTWEMLPADLREALEAMGQILRDANTPIDFKQGN